MCKAFQQNFVILLEAQRTYATTLKAGAKKLQNSRVPESYSCFESGCACSLCLKNNKVLPKGLVHFVFFIKKLFFCICSHQLVQCFNMFQSC